MKKSAKPRLVMLVIAMGALCVAGVVALGRHLHEDAAIPEHGREAAQPATEPVPASPPLPVPVPAAAPAPATPPVVAARPPAAAPSPAVTESALMAALRDLGASDPARALELARQGNRRFPKSADAAERSWTICKSLAALGRFSDAQIEARQLVRQYPDTTWASDVKRHLLTQPLEDPSQRGFGKAAELD